MAHALRDNGQGRRILIADDEALVRMTLRMLLSANGFAVTEASSGEEAMQTYFASPQNFDALILDINIGALSGDEAFRQILAKTPQSQGHSFKRGHKSATHLRRRVFPAKAV